LLLPSDFMLETLNWSTPLCDAKATEPSAISGKFNKLHQKMSSQFEVQKINWPNTNTQSVDS
jgi:hypothetical protein